MTNETNLTNLTNSKKGGYKNLLVYQQAVVISDFVYLFIRQYVTEFYMRVPVKRTQDQMIQANRSGKQNIVEGSLSRSLKTNITLTSVSRSSYGELLEDFIDFLRIKGFSQWEKDDPRVMAIRRIRIATNETNVSNLTNWSHWTNSPEPFANLMVTLIYRQNYLLDQLIRSLEKKHETEGGYSENLLKKRLEYKSHLTVK